MWQAWEWNPYNGLSLAHLGSGFSTALPTLLTNRHWKHIKLLWNMRENFIYWFVLFSSFLWGPECTQCLQPATFYRWVPNVPIAHRKQSQRSAQMLVFKWGEVSNSDAPVVNALSGCSCLPALSWAPHCLASFVFLGHSVVEAGCWEFTVAWWLLCAVETRFWAKRKVT